jgi:C1A family cysteine protease
MSRAAALALLAAISLLRLPTVNAQGVAPETAATLATAPPAPTFRGVLPPRADLSAGLPPVRDQGWTDSCVSWATAYYAASFALRARRGSSDRPVALSPGFTYGLVAGDPNCRTGTRISATLELLRTMGTLPIEEFSFDGGWCGRHPTEAERARAASFRISGWGVVSGREITAVKGQIAAGRPVIFNMQIGDALRRHRGAGTFTVVETGPRTTGHAMLAVGYDDERQAFRIVNSWGAAWGEGGFAWMAYAVWEAQVGPAFVIE